MTLHIAGLLLANVLLAALGAAVLLLLDAWRRFTWLTRPLVALLAGQAAFATGAPLLLYARLSVSPFVVVPLLALVVTAGIVVDRRRARPAAPRVGGQGWIAAVLAGLPLLVLAVRAALHPLFQFDTISNWVTKATVLWAGGHRATGVLDARFFARPDLHPQSHLEYPLGMNALYAWDGHWMGGIDPRVIHLQVVLVLAAAVVTAWVLLRSSVPAVPLAAGLAGLAMLPTVVDGTLSAYADVPVACFWSVGTLALMRWRTEGDTYLLGLGTVLFAGALALKQDAAFYDAATYAAIALFAGRRRPLALAASAGIVIASAVPWGVYDAVYGLHDTDFRPGLARMGEQTGNLRPTATGLWHVLSGRPTLMAVPIAVAVAAVCVLRGRRAEAAPFLVATAVMLGAIVLAYWNAAVNLPLVLIPALSRILAGLVVLAWLLLPLLVYQALAPSDAFDTGTRRASADVLP